MKSRHNVIKTFGNIGMLSRPYELGIVRYRHWELGICELGIMLLDRTATP